SAACKKKDIGKTFEVLVEGEAKRAISGRTMTGRTSGNKVVVFESESAKPGDYVSVTIEKATSATLTGRINNIN
ncbi:MAG TPA: TRAM domain-containing protein, partial [Bacteroidales bacterium]|nr:TRAM domain-containing protein [Bacteroidales bacterium]